MLPACSFAQTEQVQTWQLDDAATWLVSTDTKLYALGASGDITEIDVLSGEIEQVALATERSFLTSCNNDIVFVNADGKLDTLDTAWQGPEVAPFSKVTCLPSGEIAAIDNDGDLLKVDADGKLVQRLAIDALRDTQLARADLDKDGNPEIIILTVPTERYGHGVLGDRVEAEAVTVVDATSWIVKASFVLPETFVFEQMRVEVLETGSKTLVLGTRSSRQTGAGVIALELQKDDELQDDVLVQVGEAGVIGLGNRWLNLFDSANGEAYAIKTPHIGGPLQRYSYVDDELQLSSEDVGVTNHRIGSRNLDLAVLVNGDDSSVRFIAPQYDQKTLEAFSCVVAEACKSSWTYKLDSSLTSNLVVATIEATSYVAAADRSGKVYLIDISSF